MIKAGEVVSRFLSGVLREMQENRSEELHVTELVELETCPRKFWFRKR